MTAQTLAAAAVQVIGGVALAPLLPGAIQTWKARLQGRRGPSPLQPYRELRRLWSRSRVTPVPSSAIYELAPLVSAASSCWSACSRSDVSRSRSPPGTRAVGSR